MEEDYDFSFDLCIIGDRGVGKTQILTRYMQDTFESNLHTSMLIDISKVGVEGVVLKIRNSV